jgi:hypothetical protein
MTRTWLMLAVSVLAVTVPALAADNPPADPLDLSAPLAVSVVSPTTRGVVLPVLYAGFGLLQAYDGVSTLTAVKHGAIEMNPVMTGLSGNAAALWAVKGGVTVLAIFTAERLWREHRRPEAIATMIVANGVMAAVAAHNASVLRGLK